MEVNFKCTTQNIKIEIKNLIISFLDVMNGIGEKISLFFDVCVTKMANSTCIIQLFNYIQAFKLPQIDLLFHRYNRYYY